jgi:hypothetical protein
VSLNGKSGEFFLTSLLFLEKFYIILMKKMINLMVTPPKGYLSSPARGYFVPETYRFILNTYTKRGNQKHFIFNGLVFFPAK